MSLAVKASKSLAEQPRLIQQRSYSAHPGADGIENASSASVAGGALLSYAPVPLPKMGGRNARQQLDIQNLANEAHLVTSLKNGTEFDAVGKISEDEIRKSLLVEAKRRKFWNAKTIDKMDFQEIIQCFCHHYVLESFTETRSVAEAIESSSSVVRNTSDDNTAPLMSPSHATNNRTLFATLTEQSATTRNGPVELKTMGMSNKDLGQYPWDFDVQPDDDFVSQTKILEMPNSHRLGACHSCKGETLVHCFHCRGSGNDKCTYCRGTGMKAGVAHPAVYTHPMIGTFPGTSVAGGASAAGAATGPNRAYPFANTSMIRPALLGAQRDKPYATGTPVHFMAKAGLPPPGLGQHDLCIFCHGRGIRDCQQCKGQGKKYCLTCGGNGQVRVYTKLKVAFGVECTDYYTPCGVPEMLLRQASGELIFSETQPYVQPIRKDGLKEINEVSRRFCAAHLKKLLDSCRVLKQRHCVESIELAKVRFQLGSKQGHFYVYGRQRLCYIPEGPSRCCVM